MSIWSSGGGLYFSSDGIWNAVHENELKGISRVCTTYGIPLYLDGARSVRPAADGTDVTLPDIAKVCDLFWHRRRRRSGHFAAKLSVFTKKAPGAFYDAHEAARRALQRGGLSASSSMYFLRTVSIWK